MMLQHKYDMQRKGTMPPKGAQYVENTKAN